MDRQFDKIISIARKNELKNVLEIGAIRNPAWEYGDGHATRHWISFFEEVYTYDIDPNAIKITKELCSSDNLHAEVKDGVQAIKDFDGQIDLLYLDAWDVVPGTDYQEKHLEAFKEAEDKLHQKSMVLIDDTHHGDGGKGALVIPYAKVNGWYAEQFGTQTLLRKKLPVVFIISTFDKEDYFPYNKQIIESYKKIDPKIISVYNGNKEDFQHDVKTHNDGHSVGHWPQILKGFEEASNRHPSISRIISICVDDWLCDEDKLIEIFEKMEQKRCAYAGNFWHQSNGHSLATEIFFMDCRFGDFISKWKSREPDIEISLWNLIHEELKWPYHIITEREPVHWDNRFKCEALKWTMEHDLQKNIENAKRWGAL